MTVLEVVLLIGGLICIIASFMIGGKEQHDAQHAPVQTELTEKQKERIRVQIDNIVEEQLKELSERTEVQLDKISNTKILEMNEYAENVIGEINRNHNETVFLYDMLNEKAKEVKNTVKDVNLTKKQIEQLRAAAQSDTQTEPQEQLQVGQNKAGTVRDMAKERLVELVRQSNEHTRSGKDRVRNAQAGDLNDMVARQTEGEKRPQAVSEGENEPQTDQDVKKEAETRIKAKTTAKTSRTRSGRTAAKKAERPVTDDGGEAASMNIQFDKTMNNNDKILSLYHKGMNNKEIAKELNLGIGEVKLVIDLFNSGKS